MDPEATSHVEWLGAMFGQVAKVSDYGLSK